MAFTPLPHNPWLAFAVGLLFAYFVLPMLMGFVGRARTASAPKDK